MVYGGRIDLGIALGSTVVAMVLGVLWGFLAAQAQGWLDEILMRAIDVIMAIPAMMFALILVVAFGSGLMSLAVIIGLLLAPVTARVARSAALTELRADYYRAAVAVGAPRLRVIFGEVLPEHRAGSHRACGHRCRRRDHHRGQSELHRPRRPTAVCVVGNP